MNIITENGQIDLPEDFSIRIERHNPILSGEGDASTPVTLPASQHNLAALGHVERVDRAHRRRNKIDAIMQIGPTSKRGQLVLDTVRAHDGIDACFAIDNGDLYAKNKEKSVKEIFRSADGGSGYVRMLGDTPESAFQLLQSVYEGSAEDDFMVFPVAVSPYESGGSTVYQYNNEIARGSLVHGQRRVREGDIYMTVPPGYGVSPYIRLHRLVDILFGILGYEVTYNCFAKSALESIVLVNNCADTMVRAPRLDYADMVPSCTLSEFLEWLNSKFHAQPFVNSESKEVRVVMMEDVLAGDADIDITGVVDDDFSIAVNPTRRIVLEPGSTVDGADPAADDFKSLVEKYGDYYVVVNERQFAGLAAGDPVDNAAYDCLVLRGATGEFYALNRDLDDDYKTVPVRLGSNFVKYDCRNAEEEESFSQNDVIPLMLCDDGHRTFPYIGERIHFHTSYNAGEEASAQEIIVVRGVTRHDLPFRTSGTTQRFIETNDGVVETPFGLAPQDLYPHFWKRYNELILNNAAHLQCRVLLDTNQILNLDMSRLKLYRNQHLLPMTASAAIGSRTGVTEAEFIIAKGYDDGVADVQPLRLAKSPLKWNIEEAPYDARRYYEENVAYDIKVTDNGLPLHEWTQYTDGYLAYIDDTGLYWAGTPKAEGETLAINRRAQIHITYRVFRQVNNGPTQSENEEYVGDREDVTVTFTAVANE
ncbi:MAG: hypothetical protein Q4F69_02595 [Bacteroidia bacterium]|nr:hypothetical protein [Bacteroidia bacterium]